MYSQSQVAILSFLDEYLKETPVQMIEKQAKEVNELVFSGASAIDYFANFNKYYEGMGEVPPQNNSVDKAKTPRLRTHKTNKRPTKKSLQAS